MLDMRDPPRGGGMVEAERKASVLLRTESFLQELKLWQNLK